jgi:hypothetical protein
MCKKIYYLEQGCKRVGNKHCKILLVHKNMWYSPFFTTFMKGCSKSIHLYTRLYDHLYVQSLIQNVTHFLTAYMVTVLNTIYTNKVGTAKCARSNIECKYRV